MELSGGTCPIEKDEIKNDLLKNPRQQGHEDYNYAVANGLTTKKRWEEGIPHHPMSIRIVSFIEEHDFKDYEDYFCWKTGWDGDNGE